MVSCTTACSDTAEPQAEPEPTVTSLEVTQFESLDGVVAALDDGGIPCSGSRQIDAEVAIESYECSDAGPLLKLYSSPQVAALDAEASAADVYDLFNRISGAEDPLYRLQVGNVVINCQTSLAQCADVEAIFGGEIDSYDGP